MPVPLRSMSVTVAVTVTVAMTVAVFKFMCEGMYESVGVPHPFLLPQSPLSWGSSLTAHSAGFLLE